MGVWLEGSFFLEKGVHTNGEIWKFSAVIVPFSRRFLLVCASVMAVLHLLAAEHFGFEELAVALPTSPIM